VGAATATPVPDTLMALLPLVASLTIVSTFEKKPELVGAKFTETSRAPPGAIGPVVGLAE
jgi:hypothetical protein